MKDDINEIGKMALNQMIERGEIPQTIFKYRPDNDNTEKIIRDKTLWFSSPRDFNDPFDCWANVADPQVEALEKMINESNFPNVIKSECKVRITGFKRVKLKNAMDSVLSTTRLCCFSEIFDNILMWSHYADSHKGLCFQFDVLEDVSCFCVMQRIIYTQCIPVYDISKDRKKIVGKIICVKSKEWEYEKELRIIKSSTMCNENNNSHVISFNPSALKKIIFGCKATPETIEKYKRLCNVNEFKHVRFSQMQQRDDGTFGLIEKEIQK